MPEVTTRRRTEILSSLYDGIPEKLKDEHSKQHDHNVVVCSEVLLRFNQRYSNDRATVSVKFFGKVKDYNNDKAWPVRKDGSVNVESIMDYISKAVTETERRLKIVEEGERASKKAAQEIQTTLDADERLKKLGLAASTRSTWGDLWGKVRVEFGVIGTEDAFGHLETFESCDFYPRLNVPCPQLFTEGFRYGKHGVSLDQLVRILEILREEG